MKQTNFILSTVIPGPRMIGNEIDICLQPLIEELKELWEKGVETYDASKMRFSTCEQPFYGQLVIFLA